MRTPCFDPSTYGPRIGRRRAFLPKDISDLVLWLRADLGITLATGVSAWADQSGQGNHLAQATGSLQPAYNTSDSAFGGKPSVQCDGVDDLLTRATCNLQGSYTVIYPVRWTALVAAYQFVLNNWNGVTRGTEFGCDPSSFRAINHIGTSTGTDGTPLTTASEIVVSQFVEGTAATMSVNNATQALATPPSTLTITGTYSLNVGGRGSASLPGAFKLPEVAWYNRVLSASEVSRVVKYMGGRYGISVT